jgi:hypothetical protein
MSCLVYYYFYKETVVWLFFRFDLFSEAYRIMSFLWVAWLASLALQSMKKARILQCIKSKTLQ